MYGKRKLFYPHVATNDHLDALQRHFGRLDSGPAEIPENVKFILIGFTNRSGSNYLAELLASDGHIPLAGENLNFDTVLEHSTQKGFATFRDYFRFLVHDTRLGNIVSIKVAPAHIELLAVSGILDQIIGRTEFVVIERNDKLSQAISHSIAFQTGKFMSTMPDNNDLPAPVFNRDELTAIMEDIAESYKQFNLFFSRNGIVPVHVSYEHVVSRPVPIINHIGREVGIPDLSVNTGNVRLAKQADSRNDEWREMYLAAGEAR